MNTIQKAILGLAFLAIATPMCAAQTTIYTSRSAFNAALGSMASSAYTETFTGGTSAPDPSPSYTFTGNGLSYTVTAQGVPSNDPNQGMVFRDGSTISTTFNQDILATDLSANVYAVGGDFYAVNGNGVVDPGQTVTLALDDGTTDMFTTGADASDASAFRGYISQTPINSIAFLPTSPDSPTYATMDNLIVAAPEPSESVAFGIGVLGISALIFRARKRKLSA